MKTILSIIVAGSLFLMPFAGLGQAQQVAPPIAQTLVREGEFALKLVDRLKIGSRGSEAEAENALASTGIAPSNGWIADYPITPDIAGELQSAITQAADSGQLPLNRDQALMAFQALSAEMGLSVVADVRGDIVQNDPAADYGQYANPDVINNYYSTEGPPVVTYYPPPWDYNYMYAWVPYPFWCSGLWFSGFYVLNDFHRPIHGYGGAFVSNHYRDHGNHGVYTVDPATRHNGRDFSGKGDLSRGRGFRSAEARNGAASIFGRSGHGNVAHEANPTRPGGRFQANSANRGTNPPVSNSRTSGSSVGTNRSFSSPSGGVNRPSTSSYLGKGSSSGSSFRNPSIGSNKSFTAPSTGNGGSFGSPSRAPSVGTNGSFGSLSGGVSRPSTSPFLGSRTPSGSSFRAPSTNTNRSFAAPSTGSRGSFGSSFRAPSVGTNRSFSSPSGGISRPSTSPFLGSRTPSGSSFRAPSANSNRAFAAPSTGSRGSYGSSPSARQGGGHSGGFGRGGFSLR